MPFFALQKNCLLMQAERSQSKISTPPDPPYSTGPQPAPLQLGRLVRLGRVEFRVSGQVDFRRLQSNDIVEILNVLGIEAVRKARPARVSRASWKSLLSPRRSFLSDGASKSQRKHHREPRKATVCRSKGVFCFLFLFFVQGHFGARSRQKLLVFGPLFEEKDP